jgi:cytochrome c nitrite reductase small subunit
VRRVIDAVVAVLLVAFARDAWAADASTPLFSWPPPHRGLDWLQILTIVAAVPAAAILLVGLVRGRLMPAAATAGIVFLPVAAYALGALLVMEDSKTVSFCGSCHIMTPIVASLNADGDSLAAIHYRSGRVSHDAACFVCHSGYGIWGTVDAKMAGVRHMLRTVTRTYVFPIEHHGPFDIDSCLNCHARAATFRAVAEHQDPDTQQALFKREMSCTGVCHPAAHPEDALKGPAS